MFFRKRQHSASQASAARGASANTSMQSELYRIDFDMMLKGSVYKRRKGLVRQFGVTVAGSTHLVTSGDCVDRATYEALLAVGAIKAPYIDPKSLARRSVVADEDFDPTLNGPEG